MKKYLLFAGFAVLGLAACTGPQLSNNTATIQALCQAAIPIVNANVPSAADITSADGQVMSFMKASCNADGTVSAALAANYTAETPSWLGKLLNMAAAVAKIAPIVIPLI